MGSGWQNGDNMVSRGVALGEGLHRGGDMSAGSDGGVAIRRWVVGVIVIGIRDFLRLNLDYSGRTRAEIREAKSGQFTDTKTLNQGWDTLALQLSKNYKS